MSQKKVDEYKDYKKNKKKILKREKWISRIEKGALIALCLGFVGWFGFSAYKTATREPEDEQETSSTIEVNMSDYMDYVNGLSYSFDS